MRMIDQFVFTGVKVWEQVVKLKITLKVVS